MALYIRIVDRISQVLGYLAMLLLASAVVVVCQMVFLRYVYKASTYWQTEFVIFSLVGATFIGSSYVLLHRGHIGVDILPTMLGGRRQFYLEFIGSVISLLFCIVIAVTGYIHFHDALVKGWTTETVWKLPLWIPLLSLPLGIGMLCLQYVAEIFKLMQGQSIIASELSIAKEEQ
ncbi:MAG: TRAP transporter small permease [Methyloligellaceae bacterium]